MRSSCKIEKKLLIEILFRRKEGSRSYQNIYLEKVEFQINFEGKTAFKFNKRKEKEPMDS